jgi:hypothetical protein
MKNLDSTSEEAEEELRPEYRREDLGKGVRGKYYEASGVERKEVTILTRDYFAELYVAGLMADAGWNIYFPHRDRGLDFIISKTGFDGFEIVRPVQVKGKYPSDNRADADFYGYVGRLNQVHPEMVLAIPFFASSAPGPALLVAYMPFSQIRRHSRGYRCMPASFKDGQPRPRRDFRRFFDSSGLALLENPVGLTFDRRA